METKESVAARIERLCVTPRTEKRLEVLEEINGEASDDAFSDLAQAVRVSKGTSIILPKNHLENLSRGRGWARKGKGADVEWGERTEGGYCVTPGVWTIGGHDGFSRKRADTWDVRHIAVGAQVWTIAN